MDKLCHASLIDGAKLSGAQIRVFPHKNYARCEEILENNKNIERKILVTESVFSMDGDLANLAKLIELKKKYDALLMVDNAHGTGILGPTGRGATEGFADEIDLITGTLSKAVGCLGGFVAASKTHIDYLVNTARSFIFATALPPAVCAAAYEAFWVMEDEPSLREKLWTNTEKIKKGLLELGWDVMPSDSPILPVLIGFKKNRSFL